MSELSAIAAIIAKYLWLVLVGVFGFLFTWMFRKQNDTYTKAETKELIDMKMQPVIQSLDRHSDHLDKHTQVLERLNQSLQLLHTDIAVVRTKLEAKDN